MSDQATIRDQAEDARQKGLWEEYRIRKEATEKARRIRARQSPLHAVTIQSLLDAKPDIPHHIYARILSSLANEGIRSVAEFVEFAKEKPGTSFRALLHRMPNIAAKSVAILLPLLEPYESETIEEAQVMKDMFQMFPVSEKLSRLDQFALLVLDRIMEAQPPHATTPEAIPRVAETVYKFADALEAEAIKREEKS